MTELSIFRPLTQEETMDMIPLGTQDYMTLFLKELAKVLAEFQKQRRPFDSYSAKLDFEQSIKNKMSEISSVIDKKIIEKFDFGDLHRYGDLSRFEYLESIEQLNTRLVAGIKQEIVIGKRYRFKCKQRGNKISLLVDNNEIENFEKWLKETFLKSDVSDIKTENEVKTPSKNSKKE